MNDFGDVHVSHLDCLFVVESLRYRIPKANFGFSKPFKDRRPTQTSKSDVPLFDKVVTRMRDGFEKSPVRGTFPRASRGLLAEWYPMDVEDGLALRRRGYFDDTIGDISKLSYRDRFAALQRDTSRINGQSVIQSPSHSHLFYLCYCF